MSAPDLRLGDYREVMRDVECDALIVDCPYSDRTHAGQRTGSSIRKTTLDYDSIDEPWAHEFAEFWAQRIRNWAVIFCDHQAFYWHEAAWLARDWIVFAPVFLKSNPPPRFSGDGPALALEFLCVARPRRRGVVPLGSFPGQHEYQVGHDRQGKIAVSGRKPLALMRELVATYTVPGARVADACMGSGTTPIACVLEGRECVASEVVPDTYETACRRVAHGDHAARVPAQAALFPVDPEATDAAR